VTDIRKDREQILGVQRMLAMDAVRARSSEVFFDRDARAQNSEKRSEDGSEIKDGCISNDDQNDSSLTNKLTIISATSLLNLFGFRPAKQFLENAPFFVDTAAVRW